MCRLSESFREPQAGAARAVTHGSLQHLVTVSVKSLLMNLCIIGLQFLLFIFSVTVDVQNYQFSG